VTAAEPRRNPALSAALATHFFANPFSVCKPASFANFHQISPQKLRNSHATQRARAGVGSGIAPRATISRISANATVSDSRSRRPITTSMSWRVGIV